MVALGAAVGVGVPFGGVVTRWLAHLWPMVGASEVEGLTEVILTHPEQPLALLPMSVRAR